MSRTINYQVNIDEFSLWFKEMYGVDFESEHTVNASKVMQGYISRNERLALMSAHESLDNLERDNKAQAREILELMAHVERLNKALSGEFSGAAACTKHGGFGFVVNCRPCKILEDTPAQSLQAIKAEVIDECMMAINLTQIDLNLSPEENYIEALEELQRKYKPC